jgi:hypothetical protein
MKCVALSSEKLRSPIVECGFIVLTKDTKLVVKQEIANRIIRQYGPIFMQEPCERVSLRNGHYQVEGASLQEPTKEIMQEPTKAPMIESPLKQVGKDRSMLGKAKTRRKGK